LLWKESNGGSLDREKSKEISYNPGYESISNLSPEGVNPDGFFAGFIKGNVDWQMVKENIDF